MSEDNVELDRQNRDFEVIREVYSRWERGDFTSWEAFADDYVWNPTDGLESGEHTGLAEITASWRTWLQAWDEFGIEAEEVVAGSDSRTMAAFYIPSMPPALLERHGIESDQVTAVNDAFAAGDVRGALESTPDEVADRIIFAGTADDWVRWLTETYSPAGLNHALVSFADPFTLKTWAGSEVEGLPDLKEQVRIFGEQVLPEVAALGAGAAEVTPEVTN